MDVKCIYSSQREEKTTRIFRWSLKTHVAGNSSGFRSVGWNIFYLFFGIFHIVLLLVSNLDLLYLPWSTTVAIITYYKSLANTKESNHFTQIIADFLMYYYIQNFFVQGISLAILFFSAQHHWQGCVNEWTALWGTFPKKSFLGTFCEIILLKWKFLYKWIAFKIALEYVFSGIS